MMINHRPITRIFADWRLQLSTHSIGWRRARLFLCAAPAPLETCWSPTEVRLRCSTATEIAPTAAASRHWM
eukprot:scaffold1650_cov155-Pinguiococcus_pyrenoidosus.AAC.1